MHCNLSENEKTLDQMKTAEVSQEYHVPSISRYFLEVTLLQKNSNFKKELHLKFRNHGILHYL